MQRTGTRRAGGPAALALAAAAACGLACGTVRPLAAQQPAPGPRFSVEFEGKARVDGLDAAAAQEWNAAVRRVAAVLESHPAVRTPPEPLCTRVSAWVADILSDGRATARVLFHQPVPDARGACSQRTGGGVEIRVNDLAALPFANAHRDEGDDRAPFFVLPAEEAAAGPGLRLRDTYNRWVVLTRGAQPLVLPVTREEYLRDRIRTAEAQDAQLVEARDAPAAAGFDLARWLRDEKPRIVAEMRETLRAAQPHLTAEQLRQLREAQEEGLARMEAGLREAAATMPDERALRAELTGDALARTRAEVADLRDRLAALAPAERRMPACLDLQQPGPTRFADCSAGGQRLVRINPRYFDASLPRTAVQLVVVRTDNERHAMEEAPRAELRWHVFDTLDVHRLAAELHR